MSQFLQKQMPSKRTLTGRTERESARNRMRSRRRTATNSLEDDDRRDSLNSACKCEQEEWNCPIHGMSIDVEHVKKIENLVLNLPEGLCVKKSSIPGIEFGIWSISEIPKDFIFESHQNIIHSQLEENELIKKESCLEKTSAVYSWIDYIRYARNEDERNLICLEFEGKTYFQVSKFIPAHTELLTFKNEFNSENLTDIKANAFLEVTVKEKNEDSENISSAGCVKSVSLYNNVISNSNAFKDCSKEKSFCCNVCNIRFITKRNLTRHLLLHAGKKTHKCSICNKEFTEKHSLKVHMRIHTGERPYECFICKVKFRVKFQLTKHILLHNEEKPYKCSMCSKSFTQRCSLDEHFRIHTGERPFKCNVCRSKFRLKYSLSKHMLTHKLRRKFICNICNKKFSLKGTFKAHIRLHTEERPFECSICKITFKQKNTLAMHMVKHTGEKPYKCSICGKSFSYEYYLTFHFRLHNE